MSRITFRGGACLVRSRVSATRRTRARPGRRREGRRRRRSAAAGRTPIVPRLAARGQSGTAVDRRRHPGGTASPCVANRSEYARYASRFPPCQPGASPVSVLALLHPRTARAPRPRLARRTAVLRPARLAGIPHRRPPPALGRHGSSPSFSSALGLVRRKRLVRRTTYRPEAVSGPSVAPRAAILRSSSSRSLALSPIIFSCATISAAVFSSSTCSVMKAWRCTCVG